MLSDDDLKPCPFCNGRARFVQGGDLYSVCCINCHVETDTSENPDVLMDLWNSRNHHTELLKHFKDCLHTLHLAMQANGVEPDCYARYQRWQAFIQNA